jgi:hypothetical protein
LDVSLEQYGFAIAQSIYDESDRHLGVVSLQVPVDFIGEIVIKAAQEQGGYGMILGQDLKVYAHANPGFIGMEVPDAALPFSIFHDSFVKGEDVFERPITRFAGEASLAFFRKTQDGWYYGTVVPRAPYYKSITNLWYALAVLGAVAAGFLSFILARTDAKKKQGGRDDSRLKQNVRNISYPGRKNFRGYNERGRQTACRLGGGGPVFPPSQLGRGRRPLYVADIPVEKSVGRHNEGKREFRPCRIRANRARMEASVYGREVA